MLLMLCDPLGHYLVTKGAPWARGRRRLEAAKGQGRHGRQGPPRDEGRHRPWLTKGVGHEEGVALGARGPRALVSSHGQRC